MTLLYITDTIETHVSSVFTNVFFDKDDGIVCAFVSETEAIAYSNTFSAGDWARIAWFQRDFRGDWITGDRPSWIS